MTDQPAKFYVLTPDQLTEVCVRFVVFMGWTRGPGSQQWRDDLRHCNSAKSVHEFLNSARDSAVCMTAHEGLTTDRQALERLGAIDAGRALRGADQFTNCVWA